MKNNSSELKVAKVSELIQKGEVPDILFWVGCAGSFDERIKKITRKFVQILNAADIKFAVLGEEESCSGDSARRAGNEFLFQMQALANIELLNSYKISKIVTSCPHCFNTLMNEYPDLGGRFEVIHHSQLLKTLLENENIIPNPKFSEKKITFHDPCFLGRANDIYEAPRDVIKSLKLDLVEMKLSKRKSFCCGAGGSQMFKEPEKGDKDINIERTKQAIETGSDVIVTACPFCNIMLTDGAKNETGKEIEVIDLVELITNK